MIGGALFLIIGGYQLVNSKMEQKDRLNEAKEVINTTQDGKEAPNLLRGDPFSFHPNQGETVGLLEIPSIEGELPIIEGTDPDELEKGVGHYSGTAFPMQGDQIVMSGHRDTVFRRLGDVQIGDTITVKLPYGEKAYEMVDSKIVDADDRTIIGPTSDEELVITTCYPFSYVGDAPDRYILYAKPVENE
ncbi:class D sortase [Aquibacillus koreensis]|uniref:Class D sortase n=2 Tax=Aquibacillus koreensis TaxID=279446 RepID=A0A9X3WKJ5_9BACI|nr:class D sortase [Aquibacillus koreensis]MDC3421472.1 class D sortase [Aquibacillus koreensis]